MWPQSETSSQNHSTKKRSYPKLYYRRVKFTGHPPDCFVTVHITQYVMLHTSAINSQKYQKKVYLMYTNIFYLIKHYLKK